MKKLGIAILILGLFLTPTIAMAKTDKGIISVNTSADMDITPDIAEISFAVITNDYKSMQIATNENKIISEKVLSELQNLINKNNGDYIKTSDFNATPVYTYVNSKKTFDKYEVSNRVIVRTKSINNLGKMIDKAINAGATKVDNLSFTVSNYESQCNELITIASKKAKTRAESAAFALDTSLDGISSINTSCSVNNQNQPRLYMAKNMIAEVAADTFGGTETPISNGTIKIYANVNAGFFVK